MNAPHTPDYLAAYPPALVEPVRRLIAENRLGAALLKKYPQAHEVRTDKALYDYVQAIKARYLRNAPPISRIAFDGKLQAVAKALGTHTRIARVQGAKLKTRNEIHVATVFREAPPEFLSMIVAHELAHLRHGEHDKPFYQLCSHLEPAYFQLEFDLRIYLSHLAAGGEVLWPARGTS